MRAPLITHLIENFQLSVQITAVVSLISTVVFPHISNWMVINIDYVSFALGAIAIDHFLGTYVHSPLMQDDWDWRKNLGGFFVKLLMVIVFAILMEGVARITIENNLIYTYIKMSGRLMVILYPSLSAMKNIKKITNGAFPPDIIIGKLEKFEKNLDINELTQKEDENTNMDLEQN